MNGLVAMIARLLLLGAAGAIVGLALAHFVQSTRRRLVTSVAVIVLTVALEGALSFGGSNRSGDTLARAALSVVVVLNSAGILIGLWIGSIVASQRRKPGD